MSATYTETFTNPRDSLPNVYNNVTAREVDFVTRFGDNWQALLDIIGISRPIRKAPGTQLISYTASVALESGNVDAGEVIPYSKATITQVAKADLTIEKYAKAVPIEDVSKYGAEIAVEGSNGPIPWNLLGFFSAGIKPLPFFVITWIKTGLCCSFADCSTVVMASMSWPSTGP